MEVTIFGKVCDRSLLDERWCWHCQGYIGSQIEKDIMGLLYEEQRWKVNKDGWDELSIESTTPARQKAEREEALPEEHTGPEEIQRPQYEEDEG